MALRMTARILLQGSLLLPAFSQAASFDCAKAAHPVEQAICHNDELSHIDMELAEQYRTQLQQCVEPAREDLRNDQRQWLADVRRRFTVGSIDWLMESYRARSAVMAEKSMDCSGAMPAAGKMRIRSMRVDSSLVMPFVETSPPAVGQAITQQLFIDFLQADAPKNFGNGRMVIPLDERMGMYVIKYRVVRHQNPLLILEIHSGGCGASCSEGVSQRKFDLRNGRAIRTEDLLSNAGYASLVARMKAEYQRQGSELLTKLRKLKGEDAQAINLYESCLLERKKFRSYLWPLSLDAQGRWHFKGGGCYSNQGLNAFDGIEIVMTTEELRPLLSDYGRGLLTNESHSLRPDVETIRCSAGSSLPIAAERGQQTIKDVVRGEGYVLLLRNSGELLSWGRNWDGAVGVGTPTNSGEPQTVAAVGNDFVQIAAGLGFSAGLRRDGSLWTWGNSSFGQLGYGGRESRGRPVKIMDDVMSIVLSTSSGLALKRDETVWSWGTRNPTNLRDQVRNSLVPRQIAANVAQIEYGTKYPLMLKKDGRLYVFDSYERLIGSGYSRLAARGGELAFKRDGGLWAWGKTLAFVRNTDGDIDLSPEKISDDVVRVNVSDDGQFVVILKQDGSLWASRQRGGLHWLSPIGCGFRDVTVTGNKDSNPDNSVYVLAIRRDGTLVAWGNWSMKENYSFQPAEEIFASEPHVLGKGFVRLYQVGHITGDPRPGAFIEHGDGSLWQWYPPQMDAPAGVELIDKIWP